MPKPPNPFKPTAGASPPLLVGRQGVLDEFDESITDGPGAPARLLLITGQRGVGKTVMLTELGDRVRTDGWQVIDETATTGLVERITARARETLDGLDFTPRAGRRIQGVSIANVGGIQLEATQAPAPADMRRQLTVLLDALEAHETGLLLTIDEVHMVARDEMRQVAATVQHLIRERRNVAFAVAALPSAVSELLNDAVLTFLRRATKEHLADVDLTDVRDALRTTIETAGLSIEDAALDAAAEATNGYPFMIQLVGYQAWSRARENGITVQDVAAAIPAARKRLGSLVHEPALAGLSDVDRTYVLAMSHDDGPSRTAAVARRMKVDAKYASVYRARLVEAGIIEPTSRGYVDFTIPYLREYLREHAAHFEMVRTQP